MLAWCGGGAEAGDRRPAPGLAHARRRGFPALVKLASGTVRGGPPWPTSCSCSGKPWRTTSIKSSPAGLDVCAAYQKRLIERVQTLVEGQGVTIEPKDLIREVAILSERADISEEIVRLRAHLAQYIDVIHEPESAGRKLEFVVQEMGRETNTIGSKANDVEISRCVVEIKGLLEKIRELIQNIE